MKKHPSILSSLLLLVAIAAFAIPGCTDNGADQNPIAPSSVDSLGKAGAIAQPVSAYDARLNEIRTLVREGDAAGTVEALDGLFNELSADVESGATSEAEAADVASSAQTLVAEIDIDIHFGTDEKCSATFSCVDGEQMCVTVTWSIEGTGGGRNCYNFNTSSK